MLAGGWLHSEVLRAPFETSSIGGAANGDAERAIRAALGSYNDALNSGSTDKAMALYADDGVFMPPFSQSAVGREAVRKAYDKVFQELRFDVKFSIAELVVMAREWAYVRTNSAGSTAHASTGKNNVRSEPGAFHL